MLSTCNILLTFFYRCLPRDFRERGKEMQSEEQRSKSDEGPEIYHLSLPLSFNRILAMAWVGTPFLVSAF
jgi:hypothetical protein